MSLYVKKDPKLGEVRVNTNSPAEISELKSQGFRKEKPKQDQGSGKNPTPDSKTRK